MNNTSSSNNPTAAIVIIGNEILSGKTLDINTQYIATHMSDIGINLIETRTIADDREMIIKTVKELSNKYNYIFTTGGIGPTHDDITAESIAAAFDVPYSRCNEIYKILEAYYAKMGQELNPAREKMAYIPESSVLIYNNATPVPGFMTKNVIAMAGIPSIMQAMLKSVIPMLKKGKIVQSKSIELAIAESQIADKFKSIQQKYNDVEMGSYPFTKDGAHHTDLVLRSANYDSLNKAFDEIQQSFSDYSS